MMNIYTYETPEEQLKYITGPILFLAGPTVRFNQSHLKSWRKNAIEILKEINFNGSVIIPEFKEPVDTAEFDVPMWEYEALKLADTIAFWVPRTQELIGLTTNFELGFWLSRYPNGVFYGRPIGAYRTSYCDKMWNKVQNEEGYNKPIYNDLKEMLLAVKEVLNG